MSAPSGGPELATYEDDPSIVAGVVLLGALIAAGAFLSFVGGMKVVIGFGSGTGAFAALFALGYIALGLGIVMRRETARQIYVWLAVIGVILSVVSFGVTGLITIVTHPSGFAALTAILFGLLVSVVPLYVLTRPSVKLVFH